ncbi:acyltransferase [Riemerella anatipestifer]|nr:acyltransferase [Riemerella anatipestifer]
MSMEIYIYGGKRGMFGTEPWLITIGDNVHITGNCQFVNHDGGVLVLRHLMPDLELTSPIIIGSNVYIGYGSIILPGVEIGDNVVIGAGSVVNKSIPSNSVAVGVPCRVIKDINSYKEKAIKNSLGLGRLKGKDKDLALKKYFKYEK